MKHPLSNGALIALLAQHALSASAGAAAIQDTDANRYNHYSLEEIVVTSSRVPMTLRQVGTSISVIDAETIRRRGFNSLAEILRSQPGVAVSNAGGPGKASTLRIRGEEGYRTRAFIDGIDIADTSTPQHSPRFDQILSAGIERVEILRGPQGLMYGADAGGVVNISTRREQRGVQATASAEGGRYGTRQLAADIAANTGSLDFVLSGTDYSSGGFNARTDDTELRDDDGYDNRTLHARVGFAASESLRLDLVARRAEGDAEYDNCFTVDTFAPSQACREDYEQDGWRAAVNYTPGPLSHRFAYSGSATDRQNYTEDRPSFGAEGGSDKWSYLGSAGASDSRRLVYGAERLTEDLDDGFYDRERDQDSLFAEYQDKLGESFYFTAGARHDDNEDFGEHTTYRLSAAWVVPLNAGELKFKSAWGTGFRAPSLYEIAFNRSAFSEPAASEVLDAEKSRGLDLGLVWVGADSRYLELTVFDQIISDEIYFDMVGFSGYLQDDGDSESRGVELAGELPLAGGLVLSGNYTYNDSERADGSARIQRPRHLANLGLNWQAADGRLQLGINARSSRDAIDALGGELEDYTVLDLNASYRLWHGLSLYGRVENLFDSDYQEVPGYNTSGAALYTGLRYQYGQ